MTWNFLFGDFFNYECLVTDLSRDILNIEKIVHGQFKFFFFKYSNNFLKNDNFKIISKKNFNPFAL